MKFYIRELPQHQYHYKSSDYTILPKNMTPKPGDTLHDHWSDYYIDRVTYSKDGLTVYATKTGLQKCGSDTYKSKHEKYMEKIIYPNISSNNTGKHYVKTTTKTRVPIAKQIFFS